MRKGFTLVQLAVVAAIAAILFLLALPAFRLFQQQQSVDQEAQKIMGILRLAQNKTLGSEGVSQYGVYFNASTTPHQYVLFKGSDYGARDQSADEIHSMANSLELYNINIAGNQVVFMKITGQTSQPGNVSLRLKKDFSQTRTAHIESIGQISLLSPLAPSDASRVKDSRHAHVEYAGRIINTATENVRLIFPGITQNIPIASNMLSGQLYWKGTVMAGGQAQQITIETHVLNDAGLHSQFSIHRDKRYNTQSLTVELSGDASGNLIVYDAVGATTKGTSIYVSQPALQ